MAMVSATSTGIEPVKGRHPSTDPIAMSMTTTWSKNSS